MERPGRQARVSFPPITLGRVTNCGVSETRIFCEVADVCQAITCKEGPVIAGQP